MGGFPTGSPKELVKSIADGYTTFTVVSMRKFQPPHLRMLLTNMDLVEREYQSEQFDEGDFDNIRKKNFRLQNIRRARMMVKEYIRARRIVC
ncbi:MAG: hypothetical protein IT350_20815 [Deltaproteobacteria bacterium]|nr:hypothetical protein [Deltaproteobacteria bacterium]